MNPNPLRPSAPLNPDVDLRVPEPGEIRSELLRAQAELINAIRKHRRAWTAMSDFKEDYQLSGREFSDNHPIWKKKTGDVAWWCNEMAAQAAVVTALVQLDERRPAGERIDPRFRGVDSPHPLDPTAARARGVTRDFVLGWDESVTPTESEYRHARAWWKITGGNPKGDSGKTSRLIAAYEAANGPQTDTRLAP